METVAIGCNTIEDEINSVAKKIPNCCPIIWIESGLHNYPPKLRGRIQEEINKVPPKIKNIVLLFGFCGKSIDGLQAKYAQLVVPKVDDCISLLLGGNKRRMDLSSNVKAYFLTDGWLRYENNIYYEYQGLIKKYGIAKGKRIFSRMLVNYEVLNYIDTGSYNLQATMEKTSELAEIFNLRQEIIPGDLTLIAKALRKDWDNDFFILPPGVSLKINNISCSVPF